MKRILVLGAGRSAPYLIRHLLAHGEEEGFTVAVADRSLEPAAQQVGGHPRGEALALDVEDAGALSGEIARADLVVSLMPPALQPRIARACVEAGRSMVSASYLDTATRALDPEARNRGVAILAELGLDPGIDLLAAAELIRRVEADGGVVEAFESYGSGVPAPESVANPLGYAVTWNPRNVVMAGEKGAVYLRDGLLRVVPWQRIFAEVWTVAVEGVGRMEAYPNRDSLAHRANLGLGRARTLIRGTLRYPGFSEIWREVVRLGLPNEALALPGLAGLCFRELTEAFLPPASGPVEARVARYLGLPPGGRAMAGLGWLGLFSEEPIGAPAATAAEALTQLLARKLMLPQGGRDMVILVNELTVVYPGEAGRRERVTANLVERGEPGGTTAMARAVGLPAALAARLLLRGTLTVTGCLAPTDPRIYAPLLPVLAAEGIRFDERRRPLPG
jgi:saccharopine dehydrogenase-like NADP-dependent oxidoreductase